jgi:hypothetical protein
MIYAIGGQAFSFTEANEEAWTKDLIGTWVSHWWSGFSFDWSGHLFRTIKRSYGHLTSEEWNFYNKTKILKYHLIKPTTEDSWLLNRKIPRSILNFQIGAKLNKKNYQFH